MKVGLEKHCLGREKLREGAVIERCCVRMRKKMANPRERATDPNPAMITDDEIGDKVTLTGVWNDEEEARLIGEDKGHNYGLLTFTDVCAAGTSYYGVADLLPFVDDTHKFEARYFDSLVGPWPAARDVYVERSPLRHTDRLSRPMLVLQGLDDKVVPPSQSEALVAALAAKGIPHAYVAYEGEGHGFRKAENIVRSLESELSFYAQVLGFPHPEGVPVLPLTTG